MSISQLIGDIYDAAIDRASWPEVMKRLTETLGADSTILRVINTANGHVSFSYTYGLDAALQRRYKDYYVTIDPVVASLSRVDVGKVYQFDSVLPFNQLAKTEFYNDYMVPQNKRHILGGFLRNTQEQTVIIGFQRDNDSQPFSTMEQMTLQSLFPHFDRAFEISCHFSLSNTLNTNLDQLLGAMGLGIILLDEYSMIRYINPNGERFVDNSPLLQISENRLQAVGGTDNRRLQKLVSEALATSFGRGIGAGGAIRLHNIAEPESSLQLLVTPWNPENDRLTIGSGTITAAIFISDESRHPSFRQEILSQLFDFTETESRIAVALASKKELLQICDDFQISINTARTHQKNIYRKLNIRRHADLVRLIYHSPAWASTDDLSCNNQIDSER